MYYFHASVEYDQQDYIALFRVLYLTKLIRARILQLVTAAVVFLADLALIAICIVRRRADAGRIVLIASALAASLLMLLLPRLQALVAAKIRYRELGRQEIGFHEDEVEIRGKDKRTVYRYDAFDSLYRSHGAYYLHISGSGFILIPARCFTLGDPAAFGTFISQKTGLEIREIQ